MTPAYPALRIYWMSGLSNKIAVIGLGSILRRDDGIGIRILESLLNFHKRPGVDYLDFGTASFDLINRIRDYRKVLLIDGIDAGLVPGQLKIFRLEDVGCNLNGPVISSHEINLKGIFELYKKLGLKTKVYIAGIQVKDVSLREGLSEALTDNLDNIVGEIESFIAQLDNRDIIQPYGASNT